VDARAVGKSNEGGKFAPCQRRATSAEFNLISSELAEQGLQHPVNTLILVRKAKIFGSSTFLMGKIGEIGFYGGTYDTRKSVSSDFGVG
jgi:hypothetical protein